MKYSRLVVALLCIGLCTALRAAPYQVVTEEWAPYNYQENGTLTGMSTDIIRAIMAQTGDAFTITMLPSMRSAYSLQKNPKTIMYSLFRTPEREGLYKWVGPIIEATIYPYQLASAQPQVNTLEQLRHAEQITTRNAGLIPETLDARGFVNLDRSASANQQLYLMLLAGRTSLIVGDTAAGVAYYSRRLNIAPGMLRRVPVEVFRASLYIAFSLDSDDNVVAAWSRALEQLRRSGELERIERRYEQ